jgi:hypothetical protein
MLDWKSLEDSQIADHIEKVFNQMVDKRRKYEPLWEVIIKLFRPRRYDLLNQDEEGQQFGADIFDGEPANALKKFSYGFLGYMVSRAVPWLKFVTPDMSLMEEDEVKDYLQKSAEQILSAANKSSLYAALPPFMLDYSSIGTAVMVPQEDMTRDRIAFSTIHTRDNYVADDQYGRSDVYIRPIKLTAKTIVEKFEADKIPQAISEEMDVGKNPYSEYNVLYAVFKNGSAANGGTHNLDLPYMSFYVLRGHHGDKKANLLEKKGVKWFPIVGRMAKEDNCPYGTSVSADALTEALIVNKLGEKGLLAVHRTVEPAVWASKNLRGGLHLDPGGRTYYDDPNERVEAILSDINWPIGDAQMERIHATLQDKFFIRFFEMLSAGEHPQMTAFQVSQMMGEKAVLMSPIIGAFEQEVLEPAIDVLWQAEETAGRMPDMPPILQDQVDRVEVDYLGPLAQLQRSLLKSKGIIDSLAVIGQIAQVFGPGSLMKINSDEMMEDAVIAQGLPQKLIRGDDELEEMRAQIAAEEQQQQALEAGERIAKSVPSVSKDIEPNSPLALMGVGT